MFDVTEGDYFSVLGHFPKIQLEKRGRFFFQIEKIDV